MPAHFEAGLTLCLEETASAGRKSGIRFTGWSETADIAVALPREFQPPAFRWSPIGAKWREIMPKHTEIQIRDRPWSDSAHCRCGRRRTTRLHYASFITCCMMSMVSTVSAFSASQMPSLFAPQVFQRKLHVSPITRLRPAAGPRMMINQEKIRSALSDPGSWVSLHVHGMADHVSLCPCFKTAGVLLTFS